MGKEKLSYVHRGGDIPLLGSTIESLFTEIVAKFPEYEALVSIPQNVRLSYTALHHEVRRFAKGLMTLGISRGERVGIWSRNNLEWVLLQMATAHIGAILININPAYRPRDLKHALERACVQVLFLFLKARKPGRKWAFVWLLVEKFAVSERLACRLVEFLGRGQGNLLPDLPSIEMKLWPCALKGFHPLSN